MEIPSPRSVYIAFDAFPRPKGSSSHIASMVQAMARSHAPVMLLCLGYGDMPAMQVEDGVVIRRFKMYHPNMLRRASEFAGFVVDVLHEECEDAGLMVFRDPWGGAPALAAKPDAPAVFEVNALPSRELRYTYPAFRRNHALRAKVEDLELMCLRRSDAVTTVSAVTAEMLESIGIQPEKITVVPNSAADIFFNADREQCCLPELEEGKWFGYIGSLHPWQGIGTLIDAYTLAAADIQDSRLLIVHNGRKDVLKSLRKRIRKRGLAERVLLQHPLPPEQLAGVLARLRFTVAPLEETERNVEQGCCPVKIIESMAAGTPVAASNLRVCRELITDDREGLLVRPGDARAWALAITRMFTGEGLSRRLGMQARQTALGRFTRKNIHDRLETVFSSAIDRRAKGNGEEK